MNRSSVLPFCLSIIFCDIKHGDCNFSSGFMELSGLASPDYEKEQRTTIVPYRTMADV